MGLIAKEMSLLSETWSSYRDSLITFVLQVMSVVSAVSLLTRILVASGVFFDWTTTMTFKTLATAACIALSSATASLAAPINLDFTVGGVSGTFYGLDDAIFTTQSVSSFDLTTPAYVWTGVSSLFALNNSFVFSLSGLVSFDFVQNNGKLDVTGTAFLNELLVDSSEGTLDYVVERKNVSFIVGLPLYFTETITTANFTTTPISPVPLPAGGLLLLSGLAGVVALKRRKKRTA
jgi:hypothetical protein